MFFSRWIFFVSRRFSRVDRKGRSAVTSFLASLGICFGVMTLITVISVMNGFQMSFISAIMEVSSYHVRATGKESAGRDADFVAAVSELPEVASVTPFIEAQSLMVGRGEMQCAALVRAVPPEICDYDEGLSRELRVWSGHFDLSSPNSIVLGSELSRKLGVRVGSVVNLYALSGGADVELVSLDRVFTVTGIFHTGYAEINGAYAFINIDDGRKYFGGSAPVVYGIKLSDSSSDSRAVQKFSRMFPGFSFDSWRSYNRSFFGALRVEKNMLMLLVFLIFVVVGINIFSGMRRMVYERREEISVMSAFGGRHPQIQSIFIAQGFLIGFSGAVPGLALGLLLCVRMESVFFLMSKLSYYIQLFATMLVSPANAAFVRENLMFTVYASIPPKIVPLEVFLITVFGIFSSLIASWGASRGILRMTVAEVMRDE